MLDGQSTIPEKTMSSRPKLQAPRFQFCAQMEQFSVDKKAEAWSWPLASTSYQD